jgi:Trk K+ transport system NAD-binding subunit
VVDTIGRVGVTGGTDSEVTQELPEPRRFVVCGDDTLAYRLANELTNRHNGEVTVIMRSRTAAYGPRIAKIPGIQIVEADGPYADAYAAADLTTADALALVERNDVTNIDAALSAHEICPGLRMVVRMFNTSLGEGVSELPYCTVLSDAAMAAPAFVAAALGDETPNMRVQKNTLFVASREDVADSEVVCGLAATDKRDEPELLPARQSDADVVLARGARATETAARRPGLIARYPIGAVVKRVWRRVRLALVAFVGLLLVGAGVLAVSRPQPLSWSKALYASILAVVGSADTNLDATAAEKITITILTFVSIALIPLLTAAVVDAVVITRRELAFGSPPKRASDHVVVVGLGGVGSHVIRALNEQGIDVVAIDRSPEARGVQVARELRIPLIIGDANRKETLEAALVPTCQALMVITSDDVTNLETALIARGIRRDLRVVLRLFDGDMAARVQRAFDIADSHSVSYLAVPSFAAHMLGRELDTIPVGRHVLLVANLTIGAYSALEDHPVRELWRPQEAWLVELTNTLGRRLAAPAGGRLLKRGDTILVVATRRGLAQLIAETTSPPDSAPRPPIVVYDSLPIVPKATSPAVPESAGSVGD